MNNRIKELWVESTLSTWPKPGKFTAGEYDYNLEKFAELIIKECVSVCDNLQKWPSSQPKHCASDIRIHFGVDE